MKKFFLMAVMTIVAITATAQVEKGIRYGLIFSGSISNYSGIHYAKNIVGYDAGLIVEYNFSKNVYLGTGLQCGLRGTELDKNFNLNGVNVSIISEDPSLKSYNIILPVNIGGRINVSDNVSIFGQVGPYVSFAAKKAELQIWGTTIKSESFDWGYNTKVGIEFLQFQIFGGLELGAKKIWNNEAKNRSIVFGLVYII